MRKKCSKCNTTKPYKEFHRGSGLGGLSVWCKSCMKAYLREYRTANFNRTPLENTRSCRDRGAAGEHFVIHWLLSRGFEVGGPYNQNGKHDLFVKIGEWRTVQVKVGQVNAKTGVIMLRSTGRSGITSDLIALVDLGGQRIRWVSNTEAHVPTELLT